MSFADSTLLPASLDRKLAGERIALERSLAKLRTVAFRHVLPLYDIIGESQGKPRPIPKLPENDLLLRTRLAPGSPLLVVSREYQGMRLLVMLAQALDAAIPAVLPPGNERLAAARVLA